jgi:hypothetical protein
MHLYGSSHHLAQKDIGGGKVRAGREIINNDKTFSHGRRYQSFS